MNLFQCSVVILLSFASVLISARIQIPAGYEVIAYREVSPHQADEYRKAWTLTYEPTASHGGNQLGEGVYMYADPDEMREPGREGCVIAGLSPAVERLRKAWVPMSYNTGGCDGDLGDGNIYLWQNLQDYEEKVQLINGYFMSVGFDADARETLLVSEYAGDTGTVQLCLPAAQLNDRPDRHGQMNLKVWCSTNKDDVNLGKVEIMEWDNFEKSGQMPDMSDLAF
ncbi:hypothetical protein N7492_004236 [Penicillium capsulatum]|uniref:Uncharacterized protein n=1 Tax=Penicillium capsulatum TaxID=69766 RepID=A0A9W9I9N4_9EURO|nr:hypothetical protein N7492_004236 [Penicillium capsulatum]KAJ6136645.1 hypothetical protein N7512_001805 [Penicillium capsulatum]